MNRGRELVKNSLIIAVGKLATQFASFFLLPLYTSMLSATEYGTVDLFTTYIQLLLPIVTLFIEQGAFRFLLDCQEDQDRRQVVVSSLMLVTAAVAAFATVYVLAAPLIHNVYKYYLLMILIPAAFSSWALQIARGMKQMSVYSIGSFMVAFVSIVLNVVFIVVFHMGVIGMLTATAIGNAVGFLYMFFSLKIGRYISVKAWNRGALHKMLAYSIPLIPNQLSIWILSSSDRSIVNAFLGTAANGLLAVSYKFPSILSVIFGLFQLSWQETGVVHFYDEDRDAFFSDMIDKTLRVFSALCMCMIAGIPLIFRTLIHEPFWGAYQTIPIYLIAILFNIMVGLLGVVYVALKKTMEIAKTTIIAAVINIAVHIALIKAMGLYAAAVSTLVSYFAVMIYRMLDTRKYIKIRYRFSLYALSALVTAVLIALYYTCDTMLAKMGSLLLAVTYALFINREAIFSAKAEIAKRLGRRRRAK